MGEPAPPARGFARELRRAPSLRLALATLLALATAAVCAPLLANERPLYVEALDHRAQALARRALAASLEELDRSLASARAAGDERLRASAGEARRRALASARVQLATLRRGALDEDAFEPLERALERAAAGDDARERDGLAAAREAARALEERLASGDLRYRPSRRSPLLAALAPREAGVIATWLALLPGLVALVVRGRARGRWARRIGAALALGALIALAWTAVHEPAEALRGARWKGALADGSIEARRVAFAPLALGYAETKLEERYRPPSWLDRGGAPAAVVLPGEPAASSAARHLLGTDALGRDVLARIVWGARASLAVGLVAALGAALLGLLLGAAAGHAGGVLDLALSRAIELVQAFPALLLVLVVLAFADPRHLPAWLAVALVIAAFSWPSVARLVRAEALRQAGEDWLAAARALGFSPARRLLVHVVPNAAAPALVAFGFAFAGGILVESTVSYLGFGVELPMPSWGGLIAEARSAEHWWLVLFPGSAIFAAALAAHRVGEGLRAALAPRVESASALAPRVESAPALAPRVESAPALAPRVESAPALAPRVESASALAPRVESGSPRAWLSIRGLRLGFGGADVLDGVDLDLERGEGLALVGESGSGKTLLAQAVLGLAPEAAHVRGSIRLEGRELLALPERERARLRGGTVSMLVQDPRAALEPLQTVGAQLAELLVARRGLARAAARSAAEAALAGSGFADPARAARLFPHELSGGMAQRAALALATALDPALFVADEPTSALDPALRRELVARLERRRVERGGALLVITHDLGALAGLAWRVAVLYAGRVVEVGPLARVLAAPRHPYSAALVGASPRADRPLVAPPGRLPEPDERPTGCRFRERCPLAHARCAESEPELLGVRGEDGRASACWSAEEVGAP